jgi:hypothetical protein
VELHSEDPHGSTFAHSTVSLIEWVSLGGLVVTVLAIEPKIRGFKPGRRQWIFKSDKNPSDPCKILPNVKEPYEYEKRYLVSKIHENFLQVSPTMLLGVSAGNN